jgi:hypothetical protein
MEKILAIHTASEFLECDEQLLEAEPLERKYFRTWHFWRVAEQLLPPRSVIVATRGRKAVCPAYESGFGELISDEPVSLHSAQDALGYIMFYLQITRPMVTVLHGIDDIPGVDDEERAVWSAKITAPVARLQAGKYAVDLWLWEDGVLAHVLFFVQNQGTIEKNVEEEAADIGVVITLD